MNWEEEHGYQEDERGPLPLITTLNYELSKRQETLAGYRRRSTLPNSALVPLVARVTIYKVGREDMPGLFVHAYGFDSAPLIQNEQGRGDERYPGLLCLLPTPIKMGIAAVAIRQSPHHGSDWTMGGIDLLSTDPAALPDQMPGAFSWANPTDGLRAQPPDPNLRVHMIDIGDVVVTVPKLTLDEAIQARFEAHIEQMRNAIPESLDERKELVPGITLVHIHDGVTMRDNFDQLTGADFARTAKHIGREARIGKGLYGHLLRYIGDRELAAAASRITPQKLQKRTERLYGWIDSATYWTGEDMIYHEKNLSSQLVLDREAVRDVALELMSGKLKIEGVGSTMVTVLRTMFDQS
jgi:hypothetical protein